MIAEAVMISADETTAPTSPLLATIRAAKGGDPRAFEELMIATERRVALLAWRILGDAEEVKEALQETFLRLFRHLKRYDEGPSSPAPSTACRSGSGWSSSSATSRA